MDTTHSTDVHHKIPVIEMTTRTSVEAQPSNGIFKPVDPGIRLPIEYRTVSIHVDTPTPESDKGETAEKRKKAVRGSTS